MTSPEAVRIFLKGMCMGTADVVPGVSGGTMALILGIYQRLLEAIRSFDVQLIKLLVRLEIRAAIRHVDLWFLVVLGSGIFSSILFFTRVIPLPSLVQTDPEPVFALFFGLIVGSIIVLFRGLGKLSVLDYVLTAAGVGIGFAVVNLVPVNTPEASWFIFLTGMVAISALLVPGLSGSFLLLIMKKYAYILDAIGRFDFTIVMPFGLGAVVGVVLFSRVLSWLLRNMYQHTLVTIIGILIGALWVIWPFQERVYETVREKARLVSSDPILPSTVDAETGLAIGLAVIGFVGVMLLSRLGNRASLASST